MPDFLAPFSSELFPHFRLADAIDIAMVAAFAYAFFTWVREGTSRSASRRTLVVAGAVFAVYAVAQVLELYLVEQLVELLTLVFIVAAGIAFQSDIRRLIDRIGARSSGPQSGRPAPTAAVNTLVEASARMAETRIGALIAIRGREPWDRYIEGGIRLDGLVSLPLLLSTFNPKAPGHDGAVLMEGNRVRKFGAHLPLSSKLPDSSKYGGTRHSAAQGLSEHCDAFVIVVSEERGVISIAHEGVLQPMASPTELKAHLEAFWHEHYGKPASVRPNWYARRTLQRGILACVTAILLWFAFAYRPEVRTRTFHVPVELRGLGPYVQLSKAQPPEVQVTLTGTEQAFRLLDPSRLVATFDGSELRDGVAHFEVQASDLNLPRDISLSSADPAAFSVRGQDLSRTVPVAVDTTGAPPEGFRIRALRTVPDSVLVVLADSAATTPGAIRLAEPVDVSTIRATTSVRRRLQPAVGTRFPDGQPPEVEVVVEVEESGDAGNGS